jgi:hypothetical protein
MDPIYSKEKTIKGCNVIVSVHQDQHMGEPWNEHDGHGIVSEWTTRNKSAGELILHQDGRSKLFYDFAETMKIAKRDGWGLSPERLSKLEKRLGRKPTTGQIVADAVSRDFEHLRQWCNGDWCWFGYTTEINTPDGETITGDSCWGFDDEKYMLDEAFSQAAHAVKEWRDNKASEIRLDRFERKESAYLACADIVTI